MYWSASATLSIRSASRMIVVMVAPYNGMRPRFNASGALPYQESLDLPEAVMFVDQGYRHRHIGRQPGRDLVLDRADRAIGVGRVETIDLKHIIFPPLQRQQALDHPVVEPVADDARGRSADDGV